MFRMSIRTTNAAFVSEFDSDSEFYRRDEVACLLHDVADRIEHDGATHGTLIDINGNSVGDWELTD